MDGWMDEWMDLNVPVTLLDGFLFEWRGGGGNKKSRRECKYDLLERWKNMESIILFGQKADMEGWKE